MLALWENAGTAVRTSAAVVICSFMGKILVDGFEHWITQHSYHYKG
jgi:hypothetical protein